MKNIILFDDKTTRDNLLPLTFTRPTALLRFGISTIQEKWMRAIPGAYSFLTIDYLRAKYPVNITPDNIFIAGYICPNESLIGAINNLSQGEAIIDAKGNILAARGSIEDFNNRASLHATSIEQSPLAINMLYDIFVLNDTALLQDFAAITAGRKSQPLSNTNTVVGNPLFADGTPKIFIEEGATVEAAILNVNKGPIYIGKDAEIMEGSCIRGPFALCENAVVNMGARIYGATTI